MTMIGFRSIVKNDATNWSPVSNSQLVMTKMNQGQPHPLAFLKCVNSFLCHLMIGMQQVYSCRHMSALKRAEF